MNDARPAEPLRAGRYVFLLYGVAVVLGVAMAGLPPVALPVAAVFIGMFASAVVAHFAWSRAHRVTRAARGANGSPAGRIVERARGEGVVLDLPGDGLEPWALNSWVMAVMAIACGVLGVGFGWPVLLGFLALLAAVVATRLRSAARDYIRIELEPKGFAVESEEGGRRVRRFGQGALLPELGPEGLTLWASVGRIGVLRWELTASERRWLAERLASFAELRSSAAQGFDDKVHQGEAGDDGNGEEREHAN